MTALLVLLVLLVLLGGPARRPRGYRPTREPQKASDLRIPPPPKGPGGGSR